MAGSSWAGRPSLAGGPHPARIRRPTPGAVLSSAAGASDRDPPPSTRPIPEALRTHGQARTRQPTRPGQRARSSARPTPPPLAGRPLASPTRRPRPTTLTAEEEARAAELEAQIVAEERAAEEAAAAQRAARRDAPVEAPSSAAARSPSRAAEEYAYVVRDVRRIAIIGGWLIALLIGLWVVIEATGDRTVGPL